MNIIAVDDEIAALWSLERAIKQVAPKSNLVCFSSSEEALYYADNNNVNVAFLDIEMDEMNGLELAGKLKDIHSGINIIFVTGYSGYFSGAFDMYVSGYVMKPIDAERVAKELENLRHPVRLSDKGVRIQCFGNFEVFMDGQAIPMRAKTKEALAYLVDRKGAFVTKKELASILWEDKPYSHSIQSNIYIVISDITHTLSEAGAPDLIIQNRGSYAVDTSQFICDYYEYEKGNASAGVTFNGEYMVNYSWGEFTAGELESKR